MATVKKKLLFVGDYPSNLSTGQSVVAYHLCKEFKKYYDLGIAGWLFRGTKGEFQDTPSYPDFTNLLNVVQDFKPDILFLCHDVFRFAHLASIKQAFPQLKVVGYFTIETEPIPLIWLSILKLCDLIISPTEYGAAVIQERSVAVPVEVVRYGVDFESFAFTGNKREVRVLENNWSKKLKLKDEFIFLYVGKNQDRKNLGNLFDGFNLFAKDISDVKLLVFTVTTPVQVFDFKISANIDFKDMYAWRKLQGKLVIVDQMPLSLKEMSDVYKFSDALVLPSCTEGFGLPIIEAGASSCLPIVTDHAPMNEILPFYIPIPVACVYRSVWNTLRFMCSPQDIAKSLHVAYSYLKKIDSNDRLQKGLEQNFAVAKASDWSTVTDHILDLLDDVLGSTLLSFEVRKLE